MDYTANLDKVNELQIGDTIIFESVPPTSYLSLGELYRVEGTDSHNVWFRRQNGAGTGDSKFMLARFARFYHATC